MRTFKCVFSAFSWVLPHNVSALPCKALHTKLMPSRLVIVACSSWCSLSSVQWRRRNVDHRQLLYGKLYLYLLYDIESRPNFCQLSVWFAILALWCLREINTRHHYSKQAPPSVQLASQQVSKCWTCFIFLCSQVVWVSTYFIWHKNL